MLRATGKKWIIKDTYGSHLAPFLEKQKELRDIVVDLMEQFMKIEIAELRAKPNKTKEEEEKIRHFEERAMVTDWEEELRTRDAEGKVLPAEWESQ